jgi:hypothetical protein
VAPAANHLIAHDLHARAGDRIAELVVDAIP